MGGVPMAFAASVYAIRKSPDCSISRTAFRSARLELVGLLVILVLTAIVYMLLPKIERALGATERIEARFQSFADEVQPVLTAGTGKAVETIKNMDADSLSQTVTEKTDSLIDAAADRAKRFFDRDMEE